MFKTMRNIVNLRVCLRQINSSDISVFRPQWQCRALATSAHEDQIAVSKGDNKFRAEINQRNAPKADEDRVMKLKIIQLEVDIAHQEGRRIPEASFLKERHWEHLVDLPSKTARLKYLNYLWQIERKKEKRQEKKLEKQVQVAERRAKENESNKVSNHIIYGIGHTTFFLRIYDTTINRFYNYRLIRAMQFGPKIVMDCSYDDYMNNREAQNASKQLMLTFAENRLHDDPFDVHFCNVNMNSVTMQSLQRFIPTLLNPDFPLNIHAKCFTEVFPKERLVYLTPHCRTDLEKYNEDDIYVIGAMVDKVNNEPLSLAKAKKLGVRMARLPLEKYLQWSAGSGKSLTLNQMISILLDLKSTGDWEKALKNVPRRKVIDFELEESKQQQIVRNRADKLKFHLDMWAKSKNKKV